MTSSNLSSGNRPRKRVETELRLVRQTIAAQEACGDHLDGWGKRTYERHLDREAELEAMLADG